jgi:hypothetical protein
MADSLDPTVVAAVANSNFKAMSEMQLTNQLAHQQRLQLLAESSLGSILKSQNSLDISEAVATSKISNSDVAGKLAALAAVISANKQVLSAAE